MFLAAGEECTEELEDLSRYNKMPIEILKGYTHLAREQGPDNPQMKTAYSNATGIYPSPRVIHISLYQILDMDLTYILKSLFSIP